MEIIDKTLPPLKSYLTVWESKLDIPKINNKIKKVIDKQGDKQNHRSNVKAQMTLWHMQNEDGFKELSAILIDCVEKISKIRYKMDTKFKIDTMWGMKYKSEETAVGHNHWPATWSCVYYLNAPEGASGLLFNEVGDQGVERKIEEGLLIFFPGDLVHSVRPSKFKGYRYAVSANFYPVKFNNRSSENEKARND